MKKKLVSLGSHFLFFEKRFLNYLLFCIIIITTKVPRLHIQEKCLLGC